MSQTDSRSDMSVSPSSLDTCNSSIMKACHLKKVKAYDRRTIVPAAKQIAWQ